MVKGVLSGWDVNVHIVVCGQLWYTGTDIVRSVVPMDLNESSGLTVVYM